LNAFFRVSHAPSRTETRSQGLSTIATVDAMNDTVTAGANWILGSRVTSDIRYNWSTNHPKFIQSLDSFGGAVVPNVSDVFIAGRTPSNGQSLFSFGDYGFNWGIGTADEQRQQNLVATTTWLAGSHQLKVGIDYRRLSPYLGGTGAAFESLVISSVSDLLNGIASVYQLTSSDGVPRQAIFTNLSVYAQDSWRVMPRLTVTYGVRFERVPSATEASGRPPQTVLGIEGDVLNNPRLAPAGTPLWKSKAGDWAPRVGAAY